MKKILLGIVFIMAGLKAANSQAVKKIIFGAGIRAGLPIGDFEEFTSFGIGGELQGEYKFADMISGVGTIGYTNFFGKDYGGGKTKSTGYIPILAGIRVYPVIRFFLGAQIGYGILTGGNNSEGAFNYQLQVGYNASKFQLALNYNGLSNNGATFSHISLTGIFKFYPGK